jgi:hypothetical protein
MTGFRAAEQSVVTAGVCLDVKQVVDAWGA